MKTEDIKKIVSKGVLSLDEIKLVLDYIVSCIRSNMDVNTSETRLCKESSIKICSICDKINVPYVPFSMGEYGMSELQHYYGITGFQTEYGQICFLLDLTYIQFAEKLYPVNVRGVPTSKDVLSPGNFVSDDVKNTLISKGYLTLTESNFEDYIRGFIETFKLVNPINEEKTYELIYNSLNKEKINLVDKDYLNNKGITY